MKYLVFIIFLLLALNSVNATQPINPIYFYTCTVTMEIDDYHGKNLFPWWSEGRWAQAVSGEVVNSVPAKSYDPYPKCSFLVGRHFVGEFNGIYENEKYIIGNISGFPQEEFVEDINDIDSHLVFKNPRFSNLVGKSHQQPLPEHVHFNGLCYLEGTFNLTDEEQLIWSPQRGEQELYSSVLFEVNTSYDLEGICEGVMKLVIPSEYVNYEGMYIKANLACGHKYLRSGKLGVYERIQILDPECIVSVENVTSETIEEEFVEDPETPLGEEKTTIIEMEKKSFWGKVKGFFKHLF